MNEESEQNPQANTPSSPNVPPPDLSRREATPESPLDKIRHTGPATSPSAFAGEPAVKTQIGSDDQAVVGTLPVGGIAPFNTRFIAVLIDVVLVWGIQLILAFILPLFAMKLAWLVGIGYFVTRDALPFLGGQSVGKKAMKIRAVTHDGKPLTGNWEASLIRSGVLCIPFFFIVELYLLFTRDSGPDRGQRLGDEWAKTKVIMETVPVTTGGDDVV